MTGGVASVRETLRDAELQGDLERDGYAVLPLLSAAEVGDLRAEFERLGTAPGDPHRACHSSFHSSDAAYKVEVDRVVRSVLAPHVAAEFVGQRLLPCNFIAKWPAATSGFGLHQDLTLVDEAHHRSVEVWVALEDTDERNGQLWMVPGSHRWLPGNVRGVNGFGFPFGEVAHRIVHRHARAVPVRAGEALVFNHATLHFSLPNRSASPRLVAITDLIPEEAEHLHYFGDGEGGLDVYAIDDSFWVDNNPFTLWKPPPSSTLVGKVHPEPQAMTEARLDELVAEGLAVASTESPKGAPNAAKAWCHRCGTTDVDAPAPDRWIGNVTLLCRACHEVEGRLAPSPDHVAALPG